MESLFLIASFLETKLLLKFLQYCLIVFNVNSSPFIIQLVIFIAFDKRLNISVKLTTSLFQSSFCQNRSHIRTLVQRYIQNTVTTLQISIFEKTIFKHFQELKDICWILRQNDKINTYEEHIRFQVVKLRHKSYKQIRMISEMIWKHFREYFNVF